MSLNEKKMLAITAAATAVMFAALAFVALSLPALATDAPSVEVNSTEHTMTVTVYQRAGLQKVPTAGADVYAFLVTVLKEENRTTVTFEKVLTTHTNDKGVAELQLDQGKYVVLAQKDGKRGACAVNLDEDAQRVIALHEINGRLPDRLADVKSLTIIAEF
jgi:hypothetical protein